MKFVAKVDRACQDIAYNISRGIASRAKDQDKRHWISPISKLEELNHNPFLPNKR